MEMAPSLFVILVATFYTVKCGQPVDHVDKTCVLHVTNDSRATFTETILHKRYNFMYMKLNFTDLDGAVKSLDDVICPDQWIWTYKGEEGGHEYLFLPRDFGYLSFGLLWSKSNSTHFPIDLHHHGNCSGLTVGKRTSDLLVGEALGRMTSDIADTDEMYNSSYWCYYKKMADRSRSLNEACENAICTLQTIEYRCCKFVISIHPRQRRVECSKQHYHFDTMWWTLPIVGGGIWFAFYPLFVSIIVRNISKSSNVRTYTWYIRLDHESPVTFMSTVVSPFQKAQWPTFVNTYCWRLVRIAFILIPLSLPAIGTFLDAKYSDSLIKEAVAKGVIVDFSSMIAGFGHTGRYLYILGGPFIAVIMYITFGTLLLISPESFETLLDNSISDNSCQGASYFILGISLKQRENLGRISVRKYSGYKRLHNFLLVQLYMVLNWKFWRTAFRIFIDRWNNCIRKKLNDRNLIPFVVTLFTVFIIPFYVVFCAIELVFCFLYFAIPVVSCFFIIINAYVSVFSVPPPSNPVDHLDHGYRYRPLNTDDHLDHCNGHRSSNPVDNLGHRNSRRHSQPGFSMIVYLLSRVGIAFTVVAFCITWYMNCVLFFDGFWLLSRVAMFTYMGIVQFPELSYGYIILVFMAFYYLMDSIAHFGAIYHNLLKHSIEISEKVQTEGQTEFARALVQEHGIPAHLFEIIVETHMPRRVQVFKALVKAGSVTSILWISVDLLITFDKFQDLSHLSHVFTILFISALPKICECLFVKRHRDKSRYKLREKIYRTVNMYCQANGNMDSSTSEDDGDASGEGARSFEPVGIHVEHGHANSLFGHSHLGNESD